jgi:transglutaminase-like putative cysteine protease
MRRWRAISFEQWQDKARWLDGAATYDARLPRVRDVARMIAAPHFARDPNDVKSVVLDVFFVVRTHIHYVSDPMSEEFSDAEQVLDSREGDCDDKVRCFVALVRSLYTPERCDVMIRPVLKGGEFAHVQAVVKWPGSQKEPKALPGGWLVAEVILRDAQLGDDIGDIAIRVLS